MLLLSRRTVSALSVGTLFVLASCSGGGGGSNSVPATQPISPQQNGFSPPAHAAKSAAKTASTVCTTPPIKNLSATVTSLSVANGSTGTFTVCTQYASTYTVSVSPSLIASATIGAISTDPVTGIKSAVVTVTGLQAGTTTLTVTDKKGNMVTVSITVTSEYLFIADQNDLTVKEYAIPSASLIATISNVGSAAEGPQNIALDANGDLFAPLLRDSGVLEYAPPYTGSPTALTNGVSAPRAVAFDAMGDLAVINQGFPHGVALFTPPLSASSTPTVTFANGFSAQPFGAAFDASGNLFVSDLLHNAVYEFMPPFNASPFPAVTISNGVSSPQGIAFDASGDLFVTNSFGTNTVTEYAPPFSNSSAPTVTISGLNDPQAVAVDSSGNLFVANAGAPPTTLGNVQEYAPPYTGSPILTINSGSSPDGLAILVR